MQPIYKLRAKLESKGFRVIGKGTYATVFQYKKTNEVIKVFKKDNSYVKFLTIVSNNQDNPHFPKIFQYVNISKGDYYGLHIVKMEKLQPIEYELWGEKILPYINAIYRSTYDDSYLNQLKEYKQQNPSLYEALELLYKNKPKNSYMDIHSNNVMQRADNTLVIIDPYAHNRSSDDY